MSKETRKCHSCGKDTTNNKYCSTDCSNKSTAKNKNITIQLPLKVSPNQHDLSNLKGNELVSLLDSAVKDFKASISQPYAEKPDEIIKLQPRSKPKTLAYGTKSSLAPAGGWSKPFHDLSEIARASETESYLARSIQKHREYALKEGWFLSGKNPETIDYIRARLLEFDLISDYSTEEWIRDGVTNLITYHNFFLVLAREPSRSTGRRIRLHGKELEPISGIFPMDPTSVDVKQNQAGRPISWRQKIDSKEVKFDANDVIHGTMDRKTGFIFGTPYPVPVLDDIRALRRLEELSELVAHKHLFPLFHYTVGTEDRPADTIETADGTLIDEVDIVRNSVEEMPTEGGIVTSERHKIELIGSQDKILDLKPYIEHFEARVMGGLRLSGIDLGRSETSNKATAGSINKNLMDAVKDYQQVFSCVVTKKLFNMLLLEGGFDLNPENMVYFKFPPIDREELRAHQAHGLLMFTANAIDMDEYRREYLGLDPMTDEGLKKTSFNLFTKPIAEIKAAPKPGSDAKAVSTVVLPENQFGKAPKPSIPKNDCIDLIVGLWQQTKYKIIKTKRIDNLDDVLSLHFTTEALDEASTYLYQAISAGKERAITQFSLDKTKEIDYNAYQVMHNDLSKFTDRVIILIRQTTYSASEINSLIDATAVELRVLCQKYLDAAEIFGFIETCKQNNYKQIKITGYNKNYVVSLDEYTANDILLAIDSKIEPINEE